MFSLPLYDLYSPYYARFKKVVGYFTKYPSTPGGVQTVLQSHRKSTVTLAKALLGIHITLRYYSFITLTPVSQSILRSKFHPAIRSWWHRGVNHIYTHQTRMWDVGAVILFFCFLRVCAHEHTPPLALASTPGARRPPCDPAAIAQGNSQGPRAPRAHLQ